MSVAELLVPNNFNLFCNQFTTDDLTVILSPIISANGKSFFYSGTTQLSNTVSTVTVLSYPTDIATSSYLVRFTILSVCTTGTNVGATMFQSVLSRLKVNSGVLGAGAVLQNLFNLDGYVGLIGLNINPSGSNINFIINNTNVTPGNTDWVWTVSILKAE